MNGQVKALIPASIGIAILLLTGISGEFFPSGEQQATVTQSHAVSSYKGLDEMQATLRSDANKAAMQTYQAEVAEMALDLKHSRSDFVTQTPQQNLAQNVVIAKN